MSVKAWDHSGADAVPSTAAVHGHPIHPMIVPFPIAFLVGTLVTDIVCRVTGNGFWADVSYWLLLAGIVMGVVAAIFGLADFLGDKRVRSHAAARLHFGGNAIVIALSIWNFVIRMDDTIAGVYPTGLILSAVVSALLVFTGWLGGELAYRHRIGVMAREETRPDVRG